MSWIKGSNTQSKASADARLWYWQMSSGAYPGMEDEDWYWLDWNWAYEVQNYVDELFGGRWQVL